MAGDPPACKREAIATTFQKDNLSLRRPYKWLRVWVVRCEEIGCSILCSVRAPLSSPPNRAALTDREKPPGKTSFLWHWNLKYCSDLADSSCGKKI
ncbi:hypothetical protein NL676_003083 [Syzygium grande]|nr:hypothetical protein NL676_003083 [Syzygium grande]